MNLIYNIYSLGHPSDYPDASDTSIDDEHNYVELKWIGLERRQPIAPYETLIVDYETLSERIKSNAQQGLDEYFTEDEVKLLLPYLCLTYGHPVFISVLPVSLDILLENGESMVNPIAPFLMNDPWKIAYTLSSEDEGYPLPFKVCAYYLKAKEPRA